MSVSQSIVLIVLFVVCVLYALIIQWVRGHWPEIFEDYNWVFVVIGNSLIIIAMGMTIGWDTASWLFIINAVAGVPIITQALYYNITCQREVSRRLNGEFVHEHEQSQTY